MFSSRNEEALKTINQTHELENTALYHFLLGLVYEHLGRHEEAWLHYDKTLQLDNDIFDAHQKRGIYSTNIEKWKDAELDFSEMIRINPENKFGYKLRSVTFYHQKEFEKSIADARKVLAVDSADCAVRSTLAFALMAISKYLPAFEEFERCQNYDALSLDVLSRIHTGVKEILATGDTTKALNYITRISNMRPAYETGAILKAEILEEQRKWDELTAFLDERISHIVTVNSQKYRDFLEKKKKMVSKKSRAQFNSAKP